MKKKQLINEIMGVPKEIDTWVNYISSIVILGVKEIVEADQWEAGEGDFRGEKFDYYSKEHTYNGKETEQMIMGLLRVNSQKEMLQSKLYQEFPLYRPEVTINITVVPDEIDMLESGEERVGAMHSFDIDRIKVTKLGKIPIYTANQFKFDLFLPYSYIEDHTEDHDRKLFNSLIPSVGHELLHSYQQYKQMEKGKSFGYGKETVLNLAQQMSKFKETPSWNDFLHLVYLHLSFELNARVTELYYLMKRKKVKNKEQLMSVLKDSPSWNDYKLLKNFNTEEFLSNFETQTPEEDDFLNFLHDMMSKFGNLPGAPKLPPKRQYPKTDEEWISKLINKWESIILDGQQKLSSMGADIPIMDKVPESAKKDPYLFFKFFEKRFHKKAEEYRRKLTRVAHLVLQENNQ